MVLPFLTVTAGCIAEPVYSNEVPDRVIVQPLILVAFLAEIVNVLESVPVYLPLPVAVTVAVPTAVLLEYESV